MSKKRPEILLKTDTKTIMWELGREGKFSAKATGWDENKVLKRGEKIEISLAEGRGLSLRCRRRRRPSASGRGLSDRAK